MLPLGTPMPTFTLPDTVGSAHVSSATLLGKPAVVLFICNHCPFVKHIRAGLSELGRFCRERGVGIVAVSSNDAVAYPADSPEAMASEAKEAGYVFPYLYDESQEVARAFDAACTPEVYIFDAQGKLAYRGQFDGARPKNDVPVTGRDARAAVEELLAGHVPSLDQIPSIGCNIKWKSTPG
jgi:peroxiredoxin